MYNTEEYNRLIERQKYVLDEKYFSERESVELPDGYVLETAVYDDIEDEVFRAALVKCTLKHNGETVHEWISTYSHPRVFTEFIRHSNGHKYYPFHVDLYGISFLELDTLKVFNYVPEGYQHDSEYPLGESFIVTDLHYDINTDYIAFGGCFWAGTYDVMVMKLPNPLDFEMKMVGIHDIVEPDWDIYDDIDFAEWQGDKLLVTAYEGRDKVECAVEIAEIEKRLK